MEEEIRLQKYLATCGIASRRKCEEFILQGKVKVNGEVINELGTKIKPNKDKIEFNNKEIKNNNLFFDYVDKSVKRSGRKLSADKVTYSMVDEYNFLRITFEEVK